MMTVLLSSKSDVSVFIGIPLADYHWPKHFYTNSQKSRLHIAVDAEPHPDTSSVGAYSPQMDLE